MVPQAKRNSVPDSLRTCAATSSLPWVSGLLTCSAELVLASSDNNVNQSLEINMSLSTYKYLLVLFPWRTLKGKHGVGYVWRVPCSSLTDTLRGMG